MEEKKQEKNTEKKPSIFSRPWMQSLVGIVIIALALGGILFWKSYSSKISIDNSEITAPTINLGPDAVGTLDQIYVKAGDNVLANTPLARVGNETITSQVAGIVTSIDTNLGQTVSPGQTVVSMINPNDLRVVGEIDENKGLSDIRVGQPVTFTVDAFGSKTFTGVVDEISPTSNDSGVAFSISDKRQTKQFDVSVRFVVADHPEFKNGMSAKITVYKNS